MYRKLGKWPILSFNKRAALPSFSMFIYFLAILFATQSNSKIIGGLYYLSLLFGVTVALITRNKIHPMIFASVVSSLTIALINHLSIGNIALLRVLLIGCSFILAEWYILSDICTIVPLFALIINIAVVLLHFAIKGINQNVYVPSTNNYISVYLLAPMVVYYVLREKQGKTISIIPSLIVLLISFVSGSRGGFLACLIHFSGIVIYRFFSGANKRIKYIVLGIVIVVLIGTFEVSVSYIGNHFGGLRVVDRFRSIGFDGTGRIRLWKEYIESLKAITYLIFGSRLVALPYVNKLGNNVHNSFLFIHAYFGIVGIATVLGILIYDVHKSIKTAQWIYLICLFSFLFRGMTDHVFGGHWLTPVFLFLLFFPVLSDSKNKQHEH